MNEFEQRRLLKEQQREERRRIDLQRLAPEMVPPVAVTYGYAGRCYRCRIQKPARRSASIFARCNI